MGTATTTYIGYGINGQRIATDLPAIGEIVQTLTGSPKTRNLRKVIGEVVEHKTRTIAGTEWCYWVFVIRLANGELIEEKPSRLCDINAEYIETFRRAQREHEIEAAGVADGDRFRLAGPRRTKALLGTATGHTSVRRYPEGQVRVEVVWDDGLVRWPLAAILERAA